MERVTLTAEQQVEAARIEDLVLAKTRVEVRRMAELMASKDNRHLLGETEFQLRDMCHRLGAAVIDATLESRKKRGTADPR